MEFKKMECNGNHRWAGYDPHIDEDGNEIEIQFKYCMACGKEVPEDLEEIS